MLFLCIGFLTPPFSCLLLSLSLSFGAADAFGMQQRSTLRAGQTERCLTASQNPASLPQGRESRAGPQGYSSYKRGGEAVKRVGEPHSEAAVTG